MVMAAAFNAIDTLLVRVISTEMSAFSIAFFRSAFGLLFVAPVDLPPPGPDRQDQLCLAACGAGGTQGAGAGGVLLRHLAGQPCAGHGDRIHDADLRDHRRSLILGEKLGPARLLSVLMGFGGVLLIVRPVSGEFDPYLLFALAGALLTAAMQLVLKAMAGRDSTDTLVAWNLVMMVPLALLPALFFWTTPSPLMLGLLAIQGALGALGMTAITRAVSLADVSAVIPFDFLRLPLVAFGAFYFFGQSADVATWIGAAVIFLAVVAASRASGPPVRVNRVERRCRRHDGTGHCAEPEKADEEEGKRKEKVDLVIY